MECSQLEGRSILVVEDEPLIALDIETAFKRCGAEVAVANTVKDALALLDSGFSLGILDHGLADGHSTELYDHLRELGVPFIIYTGHAVPEDVRSGGVLVTKPAADQDLTSLAEDLLRAATAKAK
jgi:CheY-like chemotaxis protein